ncbi:MAG: phospholipid/cholesterol/gamma-HCH transport system substrate-binding protein [Myxococcota bacterium]|jgi:phospholipid/cholesterol/gamma-HCH transport system substrate-binding protein
MSRRNDALVGLLVLGGLAIFAAALYTVGSMREAFSTKITVQTDFDAVNGLKVGDAVWFSGVSVGTIRTVRLEGGGRVAVALAVRDDDAELIPSDVSAHVSSDGLIGNTIIVLSGGEAPPPLADGSTIASEDTLSVEAVIDELRTTNREIQDIAADIKVVTGKLAAGEGTAGRLIQDEALYESIASTATALDTSARSAQSMTAELARFSAALNQPGRLPHQLTHDTSTYPALTDSVDRLSAASADAAALTADLQAAAADEGTPIGVLLRDQQAGTDLAQTFEDASDSAAQLEEDLAVLEHSIFFRGAFRRMRRAESESQ